MNRPDRVNASIWAKEALSKPLVIFDTETTGLYEDAEIVEISCVSGDGEVLLDTLVKPTRPVPHDAYQIHGISDADLEGAPSILELRSQITSAFAGKLICCYNLAYDWRLLQQSLAAQGALLPTGWANTPAFCVMELYAQYWGAWSEYHGSYTWQNLGNALRQCQLTAEGPLHRALADAKAALSVLRHMAGEAIRQG